MNLASLSGEKLLVNGNAFGLTDASALQRAIMRAAFGESLEGVLSDSDCHRYFGCTTDALTDVFPTIVVLVAGIRGGKSLMLCVACLRAALTADLSALRPHEIPRAAIVAPSVDNARATFNLLVGAIRHSPLLAPLLVGEPKEDTLMIRRGDGRLVEIPVVAGHRGGMTLRSRWLVFLGLDEVALFGSETQGAAVSAEEILRAGETRLTPGGQIWVVSSPFGPSGLLHSLWSAHFGEPGRVLVCHAPTKALNPAFPEAQIEAIRRRDPDACAREYDADWLDAVTVFLDGMAVDRATREGPLELPPTEDGVYVSAWDPATRGNSWSIVIALFIMATATKPARIAVACARQWTGSKDKPLDPAAVVKEAAELLAKYRVTEVLCDAWSLDSIRAVAKTHAPGLTLSERNSAATQAGYAAIRTMLGLETLELAPEPTLVADLKSLKRKALAGSTRVELPRSADGRHADYAPCLAAIANECVLTTAPLIQGGSVTTYDLDRQPTGFVDAGHMHSATDSEATRVAYAMEAWLSSGRC